jgi:hypothetical protein
MRVFVTGLALARSGDKLARGILLSYRVALDAGNSFVPAVQGIDVGVSPYVELRGQKAIFPVAIQTGGITTIELSGVRVLVAGGALPRRRHISMCTSFLLDRVARNAVRSLMGPT